MLHLAASSEREPINPRARNVNPKSTSIGSLMADLFDLSGRRALVTGASRGIGLAVAEGLADRGASLVITGRKAESLETAAASLHARGAKVVPLVCHQGDSEAIDKLFQQLDGQGFTPDVAALNATTNPTYGTWAAQ